VGQYLKTGPKSGTFAFDATTRTAIREPACAAGESAVGTGPATTGPATTSAAPPGSVAPTTPPSAAGACTATVRIDNFWPQGFQAAITVTNTGTAARSPWTVTWQMRPSTSVNNAWNATVSQSGTLVTAAAPDWNATLAPGASVSIGFIADGPASPLPFAVGLNSVTCT
jgi:endoglucanase